MKNERQVIAGIQNRPIATCRIKAVELFQNYRGAMALFIEPLDYFTRDTLLLRMLKPPCAEPVTFVQIPTGNGEMIVL